MKSPKIPFLTFEQRLAYLIDRGYVKDVTLTDEEDSFLRSVNFHYFLGYARNFRKLRREVDEFRDAGISELIQIVRLDQELAGLVFDGLRTLEWRLRAAFVEHYCATRSATDTYHSVLTYAQDNLDQPIHEAILRQVMRSKEPYILGHVEANARASGIVSLTNLQLLEMNELVSGLPLWSIVDSLSFGTLVRVIRETKPLNESDERIWKLVSSSLGTPHQGIHEHLVSAHTLRNFVAHHSRIWMRPTTNTPRFPKIYDKEKRSTHAKSMYVALLSLAVCLRQTTQGKDFKVRVDDLLGRHPAFRYGVKNVFTD